MRALLRPIAAVLTVLVIGACGGDGPTGPPTAASVSVSAPPSALSAIGDNVQLTATPLDGRGRTIDALSISWASSDPGVATVTGGNVTAVGNGTTTISATAGSAVGTVQVTVQQRITQVTFASPVDTMYTLGDTVRATARDSRGNAVVGRVVTWSSLQPAVATVDANGLITTVAQGGALIRAFVDGSQGERTLQVRQRATQLVFIRQPAGGRAGLPFPIQPLAEVQDARGNRVTSDNTTVVTASVASSGGTVVSGGIVTVVGGQATFVSLAVGGPSGPTMLQLSAASMNTASSAPFQLAAGDPAAVIVVSGNAQTALAGTALTLPLQAGVRDAYGNPIPSAPLAFTIQQGGGTLSTVLAATDQSGNAATHYTLSRFAGPHTVRATSTAAPAAQAVFALTATPNGIIRGNVSASGAVVSAAATVTGGTTAATTVQPRLLTGVPDMLPAVRRASNKAAPRLSGTGANPASAASVVEPDAAVPGELLVTYRPDGVGAPSIGAAAFRQTGVADAVSQSIRTAMAPMVQSGAVQMLSVSPVILTARVRVEPGANETDVMAQLRNDPRVLAVERNLVQRTYRVEPTALQQYIRDLGFAGGMRPASFDALVPYTFANGSAAAFPGGGTYPGNTFYPFQAWHYNQVGLPRAWQLSQGSNNVLVAVVDDGVRFDHPAMAGMLTNDGYDFVPVGTIPVCGGGSVPTNADGDGPDPDPTQPMARPFNGNCVQGPNPNGNHGLHVAATIGASRTNAAGVVGVNWQVRIRPVRVLGIHGAGDIYTIAQGILYAAGLPADNGAGGVIAPGGPARIINLSLGGSSTTMAQQLAVEQAQAAGSLVIAASGNSGNSILNYPASYPGVVSVGAVGPTLEKASYSSFGNTVSIAAPGGQTTVHFTHGIMSASWNYVNGSPSVDSWQGTSMAAPHVSGIAALLLAHQPTLTAAQLRARLLSFAVDIGIPGPDTFFGAGLVNARNMLTSSMAPPRALYVRLVSAATGAIVSTRAVGTGGAFEFDGLPDGPYWLYAGHDEDGDGLLGVPTRAWGARGGGATPLAVAVDGAGVYPVSFTVSTPLEQEPNGTPAQANELVVNSYVMGSSAGSNDDDIYRLRIAQAGTYVIEVTGHVGACGFALEADPILTLYSGSGNQIATHDDNDYDGWDYCSRISQSLSPGDYFVRVNAYGAGRYIVSVRRP